MRTTLRRRHGRDRPSRRGAVRDHRAVLVGRTLSELNSHSAELLEELGATAARMVGALRTAPPPPTSATHHWDILRSPESVADGIASVHDAAKLTDVQRIVSWSSRVVERHGDALPRQTVHQDLNDFNVLPAPGPDGRHHVHAVLDFADALHTARVSELAWPSPTRCCARPTRCAAAASVVRGYAAQGELLDAELAVLFPLAAARLCINAVTWTRRSTDYGDERSRHTWPAIAALATTPPELAEAVFREAAGRAPAAAAIAVAGALCAIPEHLDGAAFGRHLEPDPPTPVRRSTVGGESATLRLGLAIEAAEPFEVHAPFDAVVESVGPSVVVLRHDDVWSRWTGVRSSLRGADALAAGEPIGQVAHVGAGRDLPVSRDRHAGHVVARCRHRRRPRGRPCRPIRPSSLGLPEARRTQDSWDADQVSATRDVRFARSQRSYYRRPMNLVGGGGSWLYDDVGTVLPRRHQQRQPRRARQPARRGRGDRPAALAQHQQPVPLPRHRPVRRAAHRAAAGHASRSRSWSAAAARPTTWRSGWPGRSPGAATSWSSTAPTTATRPPSPG